MRRAWTVFALLAFVLMFGPPQRATQTQAQAPPSNSPSTFPSPPNAAARAASAETGELPAAEAAGRKLVEQLAAGQFEKIETIYDARMAAALPPGSLAVTWNQLLQQAGAFQSIVETKVLRQRGYDVVTVTCKFEHATLDELATFSADGKLAGLYFLPHAHWTRPAYARPDAFSEQTLTIVNGKYELPATLTLPKGDGPFPAVVLVHGSGPNDADETIGPNKPFKDLALGLGSRGIAVLRYAKRTVKYGAQSSDDPTKLTVDDETMSDARAAVLVLAKETKIDPARIYVVGHSLGAYLAPRIATGDSQIAGIVMLAAPTRPVEQLAVEQVRYMRSLSGNALTEDDEKDIGAVEEAAKKIESPNLKQGDTVTFLGGNSPASYWLDLRDYHPVETAAQLKIPMLILQGGRDYQVTPANFDDWKKALGARTSVTFKIYPDLNHLFISGSGASVPAEYNKPGHVAEDTVTDVATWITTGSKLPR